MKFRNDISYHNIFRIYNSRWYYEELKIPNKEWLSNISIYVLFIRSHKYIITNTTRKTLFSITYSYCLFTSCLLWLIQTHWKLTKWQQEHHQTKLFQEKSSEICHICVQTACIAFLPYRSFAVLENCRVDLLPCCWIAVSLNCRIDLLPCWSFAGRHICLKVVVDERFSKISKPNVC
jgi:hypothetical protein